MVIIKQCGNTDICDNMDELKEHYAKWNKPERERQIFRDITYMWGGMREREGERRRGRGNKKKKNEKERENKERDAQTFSYEENKVWRYNVYLVDYSWQ